MGGGAGGGIWSRESQRECVYLSFWSPDSDREQTTEDNEKQICGEGENGGRGGGREEEGGGGGVKKKNKGEEKEEVERGQEGWGWERGRVFVATGSSCCCVE